MDQIILHRSTANEEGEVFPNFELFPYFNIDVQPELVNNNFNDRKEQPILAKKCKWQQFKFEKRNLTWVYGVDGCRRQRKMTSTDLRRTINAPTWVDINLLLPKELTKNVCNTKHSSSMVHFIKTERRRNVCRYVCARPKKTGNWSDARAQHPITVTNERSGLLPVLKNTTNFKKSSKIAIYFFAFMRDGMRAFFQIQGIFHCFKAFETEILHIYSLMGQILKQLSPSVSVTSVGIYRAAEPLASGDNC